MRSAAVAASKQRSNVACHSSESLTAPRLAVLLGCSEAMAAAMLGRAAAVLLLAAAATPGAARAVSADRLQALHELKNELHTLTADEATARFAEVGLKHRLGKPPNRQRKIDHLVILYQENRAFAHTLGCMLANKTGIDGIPAEGRKLNKVRPPPPAPFPPHRNHTTPHTTQTTCDPPPATDA